MNVTNSEPDSSLPDVSVFAVRYIAMDDEANRIEFMNNWLDDCFPGVDMLRQPGIHVPDPLDFEHYSESQRLRRFGYPLTSSEVGCFAAHMECWRECAESQRCMLILESDVSPRDPAAFVSVLQALVSSSKSQSDIVRLHGIFEQNELFSRTLRELSDGYRLVQTLGDVMGSAAYMITPFAAKRLLIHSKEFFVPVDVFLGSTWRHGLRFRTVKPYLLLSHDFPSVIGERRRPKQSMMKRLAIELARTKDDFRRIIHLPWHFWG